MKLAEVGSAVKEFFTFRSRVKQHEMAKLMGTPVVVQETFQATPADVFDAWSKPEQMKQWFGPTDFESPVVENDFKVGGIYLNCMSSEKEKVEVWSTGIYDQIIPNELIVMEDYPATASGEVIEKKSADLPGPFAEEGCTLITVEIKAVADGQTEMTMTQEGLPAKMHDGCVEGWKSSFMKMKNLLEKQ